MITARGKLHRAGSYCAGIETGECCDLRVASQPVPSKDGRENKIQEAPSLHPNGYYGLRRAESEEGGIEGEDWSTVPYKIRFWLPLCVDIPMKKACDSDLYSNQNLFLLKCSVLQDKGELS